MWKPLPLITSTSRILAALICGPAPLQPKG
jgi:hypothetical protein